MWIKPVISLYYFEILLYDDTLALLVICHIVFTQFLNNEIHISNLHFVMHENIFFYGNIPRYRIYVFFISLVL